MQKAFIKFNSITYAQLAKETLLRYFIHSQIKRLRSVGARGCAYILYPDCDIEKALDILDKEGVHHLGAEWGGVI